MSIGRYYRDNHGFLTLLTVLAMVTRFTIAAIASWKIETGGTVLAWFVNTFVDVYMNKRNLCHLFPDIIDLAGSLNLLVLDLCFFLKSYSCCTV